MHALKISQLQIQGHSNPFKNAELIKKNLTKTIKFDPDIICTPECSNIITHDKNFLIDNSTYQSNCPVLKVCKDFAKKHKKVIHIGSLLLRNQNSKKLLNRSFVIGENGKIKKFYDKIHLFDANISKLEKYKESDSFLRGKKTSLIKLFNIKIGMTICYDIRFPLLFRSLTKNGAKIILVPAAFTVPTGKAHWQVLLKARAIENTVFIIATGQCGKHSNSRKTYGHSMIISPWGKIMNKASFSPKILNTIIDLDEVDQVRLRLQSIKHG